ncbi:MAG: hypothetical protein GY786_24920, partial [Proteobacteria bacterium]|nr:hypothetical protein [Pseudomonadota bacterium]
MIQFVEALLTASDKVIGLNRRNIELVSKLNKRSDYELANDKIQAKEFLSKIKVPVSRNYLIYRALFELDNLAMDLEQFPTFVIKPARGSRGNGILILEQPEKGVYQSISGENYTISELRYFIASIIFGKFSMGQQDEVLIEARLVPDRQIKELSSGGLADIRVLMSEEKSVLAMLRLPTGK